ncbi:hypothetical protein C492_15001 [Natronococcus jeotgali DSM 18795]|uniref:Uncharacterized protein n=1 Tax=Natronococcus jeotgali DSM 18795 TaxID=1227498 RepID=L9X3Y6_9EURY|nr:hypothetical protein C492_15001 [Natronococcus jeotgali DSM 18795]
MFVVPSVLVGTVDIDGKLDGPAVTVEFRRQIMLDDAAPAFREFLLDRLSPADDRHHVGVVMRLKQRETLAIVEFTVKIDGLDAEVKAVENPEKLGEGAAGGVAVGETAHRQRIALVLYTCVESSIGMERGGSTFRFRVIEAVCVIFVTVIGPQVEVCADFHLLRKYSEYVLLKKRVPDLFNRLEVKFLTEVVQNGVLVRRVFIVLTECRDRGPVGARADEDLVNVFSIDLIIIARIEGNFLVNCVDEEVKELVLVD